MNHHLRTAALGCALAITAAACGGAEPPPPPVATTPKKKVEAPPVVASGPSIDYSYNPIGKRDPFKNLMADTGGPVLDKDDIIICPDPLCQFNLDELNVVAVVSGDSNPIAMLEDKTGVGHIIHRNSKVGRQGGKVTQILRDCIVVTSFITGPDGKAQPNKSNMCVRPDVRSAPVLDLFDGKLRQ